jgi:hypothetical protein
MSRSGLVVIAVVLAAVALPARAGAQSLARPAETWSGRVSLDAVTDDLHFRLEPIHFEWQAGAQAFGGMDRGKASLGATVGLALVAPGPKCRFVDVGAQAAVSNAASWASGQAWASLCVSNSALVDMHIVVGDRALYAVEPSLTARGLAFTSRTSGNIFTFEWAPLGFKIGDSNALDFWHIDFDFQLYFGQTTADTTGLVDFGFDMVRWWTSHPDANREVGILHVDATILGSGDSAGVVNIVPLKLGGLHLGGTLVDTWVAYTHAADYPNAPIATTPDATHLLDVATGHLGVKWPYSKLTTMGIDVDRTVWATLDRSLTLEARATAWTTWVSGKLTLSLKGYAAFTDLYYADGSHESAPTGGGELRVGRGVGHGITAALSVEGARRLGFDPAVPDPVTEARALFIFSTTYAPR